MKISILTTYITPSMKGNFEKFRNYIFFGKCMKVNGIFLESEGDAGKKDGECWGIFRNHRHK